MTSPFVSDPKVGNQTVLNITTATRIFVGKGFIDRVYVSVAGAAGTVNDVATVGAAAAANQVATIPATIGMQTYGWPVFLGLVVAPGAGQVVSVSFNTGI